MKKIIDAQKIILHILGKAQDSKFGYRMIKYCLAVPAGDEVLLFHVLTRELLCLTREEYAGMLELPYLKERWFVVPDELNEKEYVDLVRWSCRKMNRSSNAGIKGYTILTTTDCNARCFYCYEKGYKKVSMTEETAHKVADFIKSNSKDQSIHISWFGGEPLYNSSVIDIICRDLQEYGVNYKASMISNGYLFDEPMVKKAVELWELKQVQITLDGTEKIYNRSKGFIYRDGSAYRTVMSNIERLLKAGIFVNIRMNIDLNNINDIKNLVQELSERFSGFDNLGAYTYLIFEKDRRLSDRYTEEEIDYLYGMLYQIEEMLNSFGFSKADKQGLKKSLKVTHCMADSGDSVVITPDGGLSLCEHYVESERIGHISSEKRDEKMIKSWKQYEESMAECEACFYYPECIRLQKCPTDNECCKQERDTVLRKMERRMLVEYQHWMKKQKDEGNGTLL